MKSMGLDLNDAVTPYRDKVGIGINVIPELVKEGRILLPATVLAERRINSAKNAWRDNYFFLGDAFAYSPDGKKFRAVLNSEHLRAVNKNTRLSNGAIPLEEGVYETLEGEEFVTAKVQEYLGKDLSPQDVKGNPVWAAFITDKALRDEYIDRMSEQMKQRFGYDKTMGVFPADNTSGTAIIRPAFVGGLECDWSQLGGWAWGVDNDARWVGVAPEALSAPGKAIQRPSLEASLRVVNDTLRNAGYEITAFPRK